VEAVPGRVGRRGKFLIWQFQSDRATKSDLGLVVHLGMTGACEVVDTGSPRTKHTHLDLQFADGRSMRFVDPRRFGGLHVHALESVHEWGPLGELGPEPLGRSFDGGVLAMRGGNSKRALREVLLDQRTVAGVGNIYVSEALFIARLHPLLRANRLRQSAWERLAEAIRAVLRQGIRNGGTTLRDYRDAEGNPGRNQDELWVYGREGQPCRQCGTVLVAYAHQGRSGVLCPRDQARPASGRVS
jgi:formamidopyrimidine-DNA glycosylase